LLLMPSGFLAGRDTLRSHRPASAYMCLGRFQIFSSTGRSPAVRFITVPLIFSLALRIVCVAEGVQATHGRSRKDDGGACVAGVVQLGTAGLHEKRKAMRFGQKGCSAAWQSSAAQFPQRTTYGKMLCGSGRLGSDAMAAVEPGGGSGVSSIGG
jgi:hypothetical protein